MISAAVLNVTFYEQETPRDPISSSRSSTHRACCPPSERRARPFPCADLLTQRAAEEHDVPSALHARTLWHGRKSWRKPLRSSLRPFKQKLYRLGYAAQGTDYQFSNEISTGLQRAARGRIELICVDNRYSGKIAQQRRRAGARKVDRHRVSDRRTRGADCLRQCAKPTSR